MLTPIPPLPFLPDAGCTCVPGKTGKAHSAVCALYKKPHVTAQEMNAPKGRDVQPPRVPLGTPVPTFTNREPEDSVVIPQKTWDPQGRAFTSDVAEGERRLADAIKRADSHADAAWLEAAFNVGITVARRCQTFTSAAICSELSLQFPNVNTHDKRAMGGVVRRLMKHKILEPTNEIEKDSRPNCHRQNKRVLRSLIFGQGDAC